jgi:hypothetical protein
MTNILNRQNGVPGHARLPLTRRLTDLLYPPIPLHNCTVAQSQRTGSYRFPASRPTAARPNGWGKTANSIIPQYGTKSSIFAPKSPQVVSHDDSAAKPFIKRILRENPLHNSMCRRNLVTEYGWGGSSHRQFAQLAGSLPRLPRQQPRRLRVRDLQKAPVLAVRRQ